MTHLRHHLGFVHKVLNPEERIVLLKLSRGRANKVKDILKDTKLKISVEALARLRATNPKIPMVSTLDVAESLAQADQVTASHDQEDDSFSQSLGN
ncbi:unnamed protein product [Leuciscus chuanchicus]